MSECEFHALEIVERCDQAHVAHVQGREFFSRSGDNAVEVHFFCFQSCCFGTDISDFVVVNDAC